MVDFSSFNFICVIENKNNSQTQPQDRVLQNARRFWCVGTEIRALPFEIVFAKIKSRSYGSIRIDTFHREWFLKWNSVCNYNVLKRMPKFISANNVAYIHWMQKHIELVVVKLFAVVKAGKEFACVCVCVCRLWNQNIHITLSAAFYLCPYYFILSFSKCFGFFYLQFTYFA